MKKIITWYHKYLGGVQKALLWILLFSVTYVFVTDLFLRDKCGNNTFLNYVNLFYTLGLSYIASFIFYFIQVHLKEIEEQEKILPSIEKLFNRMLCYLNDIGIDAVHCLDCSQKPKLFNDITKEEFVYAVAHIKLKADSYVIQNTQELSWIQYLELRKEQIENCRRLLLDYLPYLDANCIKLLTDICDNQFLYMIIPKLSSMKPDSSVDLETAEMFISNLYDLIDELNSYYNKYLKAYHKKTKNSIKDIYFSGRKLI